MKFQDLLGIRYDSQTAAIDPDELASVLSDTPLEVIVQFYSEHGRKADFQDQYESLDISAIAWEKKQLTAHELIKCSYYKPFAPWVEAVAQRSLEFPKTGWACVDVRPNVVAHWREHGTWCIPPIFLCGYLLEIADPLRGTCQ